jgi:hypothetical protein
MGVVSKRGPFAVSSPRQRAKGLGGARAHESRTFARTTVGCAVALAITWLGACQRLAAPTALASTHSSTVSPNTASSKKGPATADVASPTPLRSMSDIARGLTDKGPNGHNFTDIYERFLGAWRHDPIRIFEIGVASGGSLRLWNEYYEKASIFAIDVVDSKQYENARTKTFVADQSNREQLAKAMAAFTGEFDFILDDGGHGMKLQQTSLGFLFKYVKSGGYYVIEDLHTSLTERYPGGGYGADPDGENTTLRMLERYVHGQPPKFDSKYLLPQESAYLDKNVASLVISFRHDQEHSMVCLIQKR